MPVACYGSVAGDIHDQDDAELEATGYQREMPRQYSMMSLLALAYALICTWNGFGSALGTGLRTASTAGSIFMLLPAAGFIGVVSLGMAELTSAYPVASGQFYWVYALSPPEWAPFASYMTGVISVIGLWLGGASTYNFISGMTLSIAQFIHSDYEIEAWHKYLVYVAVVWLSAGINIFGSRALPSFNKFIFSFSLATFIISVAAMLAGSYPNYRPARWVFTDVTDSTGWGGNGVSLIFCFINALYGFLGTDAGVHMTEEIPNPSVNGPKVILYPVLIGLMTVVPFACTCMFVIKDMDAILHAPSGLPLIQVYYQATQSSTTTVLLMVAFTVCFFACGVANMTGASRQIWSAARDECFPLSEYWKKINPTYQMPLNAVLVQAVFNTAYGLIFLGSQVAFSLMVSASIIFLVGSYVIPQAILTFRNRERLLPPRAFDLGRWGYIVNMMSTVWTLFLCIACCIPTELPITKSNMNYNSVVALSLLALAYAGWIYSRKGVFKGPKIDTQLLYNARVKALQATDEQIDERTYLIQHNSAYVDF
ncbi:amino acid/polyamine transporter I [Aspergillus alliaceus]|uniref:amino acid/polyamine transporter I n=1 Tax=Petromyces alliaceus TaxID=209559 RepID=UPI0012A739AF|nr:amino acid/polyamine transporter I [Aspergillus alliaceus]KAB8229508.1 amino acid/polyamine transporter I [Aspergillus alliaceus]